MARMPGAKWSGEHSPRNRMQRYDIACIHTIVGTAPAPAAHFSTSGGGTIWQSRDTKYRSAANLNGNHRIIAIENADHGAGFPAWNVNDGHAVPAFTSQQIEAIARILAWVHRTHGIPLALVPDSRPGRRGIAYHRQGVDGNWAGYRYGGRVSGGEVWTNARGKVCPGDRRIAQIPLIIARARQLVGLGGGVDKDDPLAFIDGPDEFRQLVRQANIQSVRDETEYRQELRKLIAEEVRRMVSDGLTGWMNRRTASWFETRVANGVANAASTSTKFRNAVRDLVR